MEEEKNDEAQTEACEDERAPEKTFENTSFVIQEKKCASSYECGKPGARHKIYYEDAADLKKKIDALVEIGAYEKPEA